MLKTIAWVLLFTVALATFQRVSRAGTQDELQTSKNRQEDGSSKPIQKQTAILLDAGHGGYDSGSVNADETILEKDIALAIALQTGVYLEDAGYRIVYSRTSDTVNWPEDNVADLQARVDLGVEEEADYFISFHLNSTETYHDGIRGFETYITPGNRTREIAEAIHTEIDKLDYSNNRGINDYLYEGLHVLGLNPIPAMLLELGFITDDQDLQHLNDPAFQKQLAQAIANGISKTLN